MTLCAYVQQTLSLALSAFVRTARSPTLDQELLALQVQFLWQYTPSDHVLAVDFPAMTMQKTKALIHVISNE